MSNPTQPEVKRYTVPELYGLAIGDTGAPSSLVAATDYETAEARIAELKFTIDGQLKRIKGLKVDNAEKDTTIKRLREIIEHACTVIEAPQDYNLPMILGTWRNGLSTLADTRAALTEDT